MSWNYTTKADAINVLYGDAVLHAASDGTVTWVDGHETTDSEVAAIETKFEELIVEFNAQAYSRNRQDEYPDWSVQLEKIYDDGITKWKSEMIDPIKTKWPKNNTGPVE